MNTSEDAGSTSALLAFGQQLKRLRLADDLTQEELAERAGVSARLVSDLERGTIHRPRRDTVQLLADGLRLRGVERDTFVALARGRSKSAAQPAGAGKPALALPQPPTPLVGREHEVDEAVALLLDPEVRLLTLTGPGGVGKTRLAVEIGARVGASMPGGAAFVDLAPVRAPDLVLTAIAHALDVRANPESSLAETVVDHLREQRLLLVLDNFEHLALAASDVAGLLAACPRLTVLATSRRPIHVRAEHQFPVGPLTLPDLQRLPSSDELRAIPAVELFLRRAQAVNREFVLTPDNARTIAEITVQLDGLPLAIELAATRARALSPAALLCHLERRLPLLTGGFRDLPERQRTLRATLDWSHDLLTAAEQVVFRRLAVFAGGCSLEGAAVVSASADRLDCATPGIPSPDGSLLPDVLGGLVDANLLRTYPDHAGELRFGMLETVREYGLERLAAANEEAAVWRGHVDWSLELAKRAEPELTGAAQQQWFARLRVEHDNLRAALAWAIADNATETALSLGGALYRFWATQGHYEEGRRWLETALAMSDGVRTAPRAHALLGAGVMAYFQGRYDDADAFWREALTIFRELGDTTGVAYSYGNLGLVADALGDYERARASYEEALALFRELDDPTYIAYMLHNLGLIAYFQGEYARATALYEESLTLVRALGDQNSIALTLGNLGLAAFVQGDLQRALALQHEALTLGRFLSNKPWLARAVENFALIAAATGGAARAAALFGAAAAMREAFHARLPPNDQEFNARYIAQATAELGNDAFAAAWNRGQAMAEDEAIDVALEIGRQDGRR